MIPVTTAENVAKKLILMQKQTFGEDFEISKTKTMKLTYYCFAWYLVASENKTLLFDDSIEAWTYGPVIPSIFNKWKEINNSLLENEIIKFDDEIEDLFNEVAEVYFGMEKKDLVMLSHSESPWLSSRKGIKPNEPSNNNLNNDEIYSYYSSLIA